MSIKSLLTKVDDNFLRQTRNFCKVDEGIDDELLSLEVLAARKKVISEVGDKLDNFFDNNPLFKAAVLIDVFTHYNNRDKDSNAMIFSHSPYQDDINSMKDDYRYLVEEYGADYEGYYDWDTENPNNAKDVDSDANGSTQD